MLHSPASHALSVRAEGSPLVCVLSFLTLGLCTPSFCTAQPSSEAALAEQAEAGAFAAPVEVNVQRRRSQADRLRRSAEAVSVVETVEAKRQSHDLGEVLARTQGVAVQRSSGLGSETRIFLNGLTDDQVRFFLDGIPLDLTGYPFGMANIPVNLVDRIEIYRGVVPVRFGADALGGAINLVSDGKLEHGAHSAASLQTGSFGTYRATASGRYLGKSSGWLTRAAAFFDRSQNNYPMNIDVPDDSGQEVRARVYRFHDGYRALGANVETGVTNKTWARRFLLKAFISDYDKEVQHNLVMTFNPYGDVEYGQRALGGTATYQQVFLQQLALSVVAGYTHRHITYTDLGECVYNWFGQCIRDRKQPGERIGRAQDQDYYEHNAYGRINLKWQVHRYHALHASLSPTYTKRSGTEHRLANPDTRDPLSAKRQLGGFLTGVEYEADPLPKRLKNSLFLKDYLQLLRSEDPLSNGVDFRKIDRTTHRIGVGDNLRCFLLDHLYAKASYEWATRLPRPDEVFGDAFPIQANLSLRPELSHNVNLSLTLDPFETAVGEWHGEVNGFLREVRDLIRIVGDDESASYQNVRDARSLGVEGVFGWTSPGQYVAIDGNATYVDLRNRSKGGPDSAYNGDRIPNRPYLFATGTARFQLRNVAAAKDALSLSWTSRYVHSFFRGWESIGTDKPIVPEQLLHSLAVTYVIEGDPLALSFSGEAHNLTDAEAYDYFGVPKPGRAFYFKMTASL